MIYITGDTHRDFSRIKTFCKEHGTNQNDDVMIILGDAGINYFCDHRDDEYKRYLQKFPVTFFCVHGNHEMRPWHCAGMIVRDWHGAPAYHQEAYPNIYYAMDASIYHFAGYRCLVIGGAYSVDKYYRLSRGWHWFPDEQPTEEIKKQVDRAIAENSDISVVLSHTCPYQYIPKEAFLSSIDQSTVDDSTERYLDTVKERVNYQKWYCGHWHTNKAIDKMQFLFEDVMKIGA